VARAQHTVPVLLGTAVIGMISLVAVAASTGTASSDDTRGGATVVECRSGVVTEGEVSMSALTVSRVEAAPPELPGGCRVVP
jgi:hypothetical protein